MPIRFDQCGIKQMPSSTDEWNSAVVLVLARGFADYENLRKRISTPTNDTRAML
jgi:hypothetical protein